MLKHPDISDASRQVTMPGRFEGEVSRHAYVKDGQTAMVVIKFEGGGDKRLFCHRNSLSTQWLEKTPSSYLPLLYNFDALVERRDEPVFYVECEREADRLTALGLTATTYGTPAAIAPCQQHIFKGRRIIAVGSESGSGYDHVNAVNIEYGGEAYVQSVIVESPLGRTVDGYTLADWLRDTEGEDQGVWLLAVARGEATLGSPPRAAGKPVDGISGAAGCVGHNTKEACSSVSADVRVLGVGTTGQTGGLTANDNSTPEQRGRLARIVRSNDRLAGAEPEWLVEGILPKVGTGMLYAESAGGKSFTGIDLCYGVENGLPWGGRNAARGKAIYVAAEDSAGVCFRAACQFEFEGLETPFNIIRADQTGLDLTGKAADLDGLIADIEYAGGADDVRLVIIDTFEKIAEGVDENGSSTVRMSP